MFGFVYEDSNVELESIKSYLEKNNINKINYGLMILSGGCTMFDIAPYFENLIAFDTNKEQINLVKTKINLIENNNKDLYKIFLENIDMNFDRMCKQIKNREDIFDIFDRKNLIKNFGSNAVENTSHNFAEHFISVYDTHSEYHDFIFNRNMDIKIKNFNYYHENINKIKSVKMINDNIINFLENSDDKYNFIQTSNITDWISNKQFIKICNLLKSKLNKNGILIMRRMLSDNILENEFPKCIRLKDNTNIYTEFILWINN
jgi:S-adenosylmethionine:diacylglycerol 3-amino-3-carboxypropyl transferase